MKRRTSFAIVALVVALLLGTPVWAQESSPTIDIRGFGGWAAGYTSNDNLYPDSPTTIASNEFEVDNYYFTLNLIARPTDKIVIHAQPTWESSVKGRRATLDVAYAEVSVVKDLRVRAGKIRNPLGLYTDIYKVGTLRPFYLLPNAYYRAAPEGYAGLGINGVKELGSWEIEADAIAGQMTFEPTDFDTIVGLDPVTGAPSFASLETVLQGRKVLAGGLMLRTPVKGLQFGGAFYSMELFASIGGTPSLKLSDERQKAYSTSAEFLTDRISLRSEALILRGFEDSDSWYVEAAYHLTNHWQVAGTYWDANFKEPPPVVEQLGKDKTFGLALNYWQNPKLVWKLNYYRVQDNRAARPPNAVVSALAGTLEKETDVLIGGVHFSF